MSRHTALIRWARGDAVFTDNAYSRGHTWTFDGGLTVPASASPAVVPVPHAVPENVDPEEAFVAALSSCHMLFFLSIAAKKRYTVDSYEDDACGHLGPDAAGREAITRVELRPRVRFSGDRVPTERDIARLHDLAHHHCFLANSVRFPVEVVPPDTGSA
ncbi:OsmC family protein [bacterium]|nr:OsmC family protein [bacterium]